MHVCICIPPKNALIALFSAEVRPTCSKNLQLYWRVQIMIWWRYTISTYDTSSKTSSKQKKMFFF